MKKVYILNKKFVLFQWQVLVFSGVKNGNSYDIPWFEKKKSNCEKY